MSICKWLCIGIAIITLTLPHWVGASEIAKIANLAQQPFNLNPFVEFIRDPERSISYQMISDNTAVKSDGVAWQRQKGGDHHFVPTELKDRYWFKASFHLDEQAVKSVPVLYFKTHPSLLVKLDIWIPKNGETKVFSVGVIRDFAGRDIHSRQYWATRTRR